MSRIVIGGGNTRVGEVYLDAVFRQRALQQQANEQAMKLRIERERMAQAQAELEQRAREAALNRQYEMQMARENRGFQSSEAEAQRAFAEMQGMTAEENAMARERRAEEAAIAREGRASTRDIAKEQRMEGYQISAEQRRDELDKAERERREEQRQKEIERLDAKEEEQKLYDAQKLAASKNVDVGDLTSAEQILGVIAAAGHKKDVEEMQLRFGERGWDPGPDASKEARAAFAAKEQERYDAEQVRFAEQQQRTTSALAAARSHFMTKQADKYGQVTEVLDPAYDVYVKEMKGWGIQPPRLPRVAGESSITRTPSPTPASVRETAEAAAGREGPPPPPVPSTAEGPPPPPVPSTATEMPVPEYVPETPWEPMNIEGGKLVPFQRALRIDPAASEVFRSAIPEANTYELVRGEPPPRIMQPGPDNYQVWQRPLGAEFAAQRIALLAQQAEAARERERALNANVPLEEGQPDLYAPAIGFQRTSSGSYYVPEEWTPRNLRR